jgi:hypothetical protein
VRECRGSQIMLMMALNLKVRFEQAVYGSFPFWHRGYAVLARSARCHPGWLAEVKTICQRFGEPPAGWSPAQSLFALRLDSGPWTIVNVHPHGSDDRGRPGALAFHALFVNPWAYRLSGSNPFAFAHAFRRGWTKADIDATLPAGSLSLRQIQSNASAPGPSRSDLDPRVVPIVSALSQGRRVVVESSEPIDVLARSVWNSLLGRVRLRSSVATWAFDNANGFDLVALPKLAGTAPGASDLILGFDHARR